MENRLVNNYCINPEYVCKSRINSLVVKALGVPNLTVDKAKLIFDKYNDRCVVEQTGHPYDLSKRRFVKYMKLSELRSVALYEKYKGELI